MLVQYPTVGRLKLACQGAKEEGPGERPERHVEWVRHGKLGAGEGGRAEDTLSFSQPAGIEGVGGRQSSQLKQ